MLPSVLKPHQHHRLQLVEQNVISPVINKNIHTKAEAIRMMLSKVRAQVYWNSPISSLLLRK